jgi:hypothetical protein
MNKDAKRHMPQAPTLVAPDAEPSQSDSLSMGRKAIVKRIASVP